MRSFIFLTKVGENDYQMIGGPLSESAYVNDTKIIKHIWTEDEIKQFIKSEAILSICQTIEPGETKEYYKLENAFSSCVKCLTEDDLKLFDNLFNVFDGIDDCVVEIESEVKEKVTALLSKKEMLIKQKNEKKQKIDKFWSNQQNLNL